MANMSALELSQTIKAKKLSVGEAVGAYIDSIE
jgi:Asp-tRNA(Asn)/Glu-tRNA(Gln) amidotransferase A subunit family amidase